MSSGLMTTVFVMTMVIGLAVWARYSIAMKRALYFGVAIWNRWLPFAGTAWFLAIVTINLLAPRSNGALSLTGAFSRLELLVLFFVGPLFLTRIGNVLAVATLIYCAERLAIGPGQGTVTLGIMAVGSAATFVAVLGDRMPWYDHGPSPVAHKLREILFIVVAVAAIAIVFGAILNVYGFSRWLAVYHGIEVPVSVLIGGLVVLFFGWLSTAVGFGQQITPSLLILPSLFLFVYVTNCPPSWLFFPFSLTLALSLAKAEKRVMMRRDRQFHHGAAAA